MSIKPRDILEHAQSLNTTEDDSEVLFRLLINRIYYSAYGHLLNEVENRLFYKLDASNPSVHQRLINVFKNTVVSDSNEMKILATIATKLRQAKYLRIKADYELDTDVNKNEVKRSFQLAEELYDLVEKLN